MISMRFACRIFKGRILEAIGRGVFEKKEWEKQKK